MYLWVTALVPCELKGAQHLKIQIVISYVFACNKNKALQLQRAPILSILGYNIDLYFKQALQFPKPKTNVRQI